MAEIRFAKKEELEQINRLRAQAAALHNQNRPDVYPPFSPALAEEALKLWEDSDADTIVAVQDGAAAGYAVVFYRDIPSSPHSVARRVCHIEEFAVDEAYRRRQIGAQLPDPAERLGFQQTGSGFLPGHGLPAFPAFHGMSDLNFFISLLELGGDILVSSSPLPQMAAPVL